MRLIETAGVAPVAYIDIVENVEPGAAVKQEIVDISTIGFVPKELIFDVDAEGHVIGVEIL